MKLIPKKLLTIVAESALEEQLIETIKELGAPEFILTDCKTYSSHGFRAGDWDQNRNISIRILCEETVAHNIMAHVEAEFANDYSVRTYVVEAQMSSGSE